MSATALPLNRLSRHVLSLLEFLHRKVSRYDAVQEPDALSDTTLADVGLERSDIAAHVNLEMSRIDRLGLGR